MDTKMFQGRPWYLSLQRKVFPKSQSHSRKAEPSTPRHNSQSGIYDPATAPSDPHTDEKHMPKWLVKVLQNGDKITTVEVMRSDGISKSVEVKVVESPGLVDALAKLSRMDLTVKRAIYCSSEVHYVAKTRREGSFCGYRNIQMMISYVYNVNLLARRNSSHGHLPSIFMLQDMIEAAWDKGFNSSARNDLGSVRMTRKFIGTSEAEALLLNMGLRVSTRSFVSTAKVSAFTLLLKHVSIYFESENESGVKENVAVTQKPPLYLQRPGHSLTIVGISEDTQGVQSLMVFDPKHLPVLSLRKMAREGVVPDKPAKIIRTCRYGTPELASFDAFEILQLDGHVMRSDDLSPTIEETCTT